MTLPTETTPESGGTEAADVATGTPATSNLDASLDSLMADHGLEVESQPTETAPEANESEQSTDKAGRQRGPDGKFISTKTADASSEATADSTSGESTPSDDPKGDYEKAAQALARDGAAQFMLDRLAAGDEDMLQYALTRADRQAEIDGKFDEHAQTKQRLALLESQTTATDSDDGAEETPAGTDQLPDLKEAVNQFGNELNQYLGDEVNEPLQQLGSVIESQLSGVHEALEGIKQMHFNMALDHARDGLLNEWPQLADRATFEAVVKHMDAIKLSEERPDIRSLMHYAAQVELAPKMAQQARAAQTATNSAKDAGTPRASTTAAKPQPAATRDEVRDAMLDNLIEGGDSAEYDGLKRQAQRMR